LRAEATKHDAESARLEAAAARQDVAAAQLEAERLQDEADAARAEAQRFREAAEAAFEQMQAVRAEWTPSAATPAWFTDNLEGEPVSGPPVGVEASADDQPNEVEPVDEAQLQAPEPVDEAPLHAPEPADDGSLEAPEHVAESAPPIDSAGEVPASEVEQLDESAMELESLDADSPEAEHQPDGLAEHEDEAEELAEPEDQAEGAAEATEPVTEASPDALDPSTVASDTVEESAGGSTDDLSASSDEPGVSTDEPDVSTDEPNAAGEQPNASEDEAVEPTSVQVGKISPLGWSHSARLALTASLADCASANRLLETAVRVIGTRGGWDAAIAWTRDTRSSNWTPVTCWTASPDAIDRFETLLKHLRVAGSSAIAQAAFEGKINWFCEPVPQDDTSLTTMTGEGMSSFAVVPLKREPETTAVLQLCSRHEGRPGAELRLALDAMAVEVGSTYDALGGLESPKGWGRWRRR
jgi:hypothetical protein